MSQKEITEDVTADLIRFPAVWFENGFAIVLTGSTRRATRLGLKKGSYKKALIVDADGNSFRVAGVKRKRIQFSWRMGKIIGLLEGNPTYEVEWAFTSALRISLDAVKELFLKSFKKEREYWDEMCDFEEFRNKLTAANSFDELFGVLRNFHFMS